LKKPGEMFRKSPILFNLTDRCTDNEKGHLKAN
jgi:hypothetical protein